MHDTGSHTSSKYFLKFFEHEYLIHCELTAHKIKHKKEKENPVINRFASLMTKV